MSGHRNAAFDTSIRAPRLLRPRTSSRNRFGAVFRRPSTELGLDRRMASPVELQERSGFAEGSGGMAIAETADADVVGRICAPWTPRLQFTVKPMQPIRQFATTMAEAGQFWAAVG